MKGYMQTSSPPFLGIGSEGENKESHRLASVRKTPALATKGELDMEEEKIREQKKDLLSRVRQQTADQIMSVHNIDKSPLEIADQILSLDGIRIQCEKQDLPVNPYNGIRERMSYLKGTQDMLTPKDGKVWVQCLVKEEK